MFVGGLAANLIINLFEYVTNGVVLAPNWDAPMKALVPAPPHQCYTCLHCRRLHRGVAAIWLYAAARTRFGAGPNTAGLTGFTYWIMGYALPTLGQIPVGLFPKRLSVCGQRCRRLVLQGMILRLQRYLRQDAPT